MADLIDRATLAEEIESLTVTVAGKPARWYDAKHSVLQVIAEQPTIDPESLLPKWISVEDRLPKNSTYVNVVTDGVVAQAYWRNGKFYEFTVIGVATVTDVTHWMPLPEPPNGDMRGDSNG